MRTWIDNQFYYWGHLEFDTFTGPVHSTGESLSMEEAMERTQMFTGLLDKSGKEIWEGDIVKSSFRPSKSKDIYEVKWLPKYAEFSIQEAGVCRDCIEIIGNIYENPELLEEIADA